MVQGAPDWSQIIQIRALDEDGNLHDVRVDDAGRLVMTPYGTVTVDGALDVTQTDLERLVSGTDGIDQIPLAVDANGRLVMLPYGYTGAGFVPLRVDADGFMQAIMLGDDGAALRQLLVDAAGRLLAAIQDPVTENFLGIDAAGFATVVIKGDDGVDLQTLLVDDVGRLLAAIQDPDTDNFLAIDDDGYATVVMKGDDDGTLRTLEVDSGGRLIAVFRDPTSDNYAAVSEDGYLGAILRGGADISLGVEVWYRFRNQEGTTIRDYSGNSRHALSYNGVPLGATYADGVVGDAIQLDGTDDYVAFPTITDLDNLSEFTIEFWGYSDGNSSADARALTKDSLKRVIWYVTGIIRVQYNAASTSARSQIASALDSDTWYHIVITYSDTGDRIPQIYVDGELAPLSIDQAAEGALVDDSGGDWVLGKEAAKFFGGFFDELRFYSRVLSPNEVRWRYNRTHVALDERYRPLAVDPEGRLEVAIQGFGYQNQVLQQASNVYGGGGAQSEQTSVVPNGKMWVLTGAMMHSNGVAINAMDIGIYDGSNNHIIQYEYGAGGVYRCQFIGQIVLKPGDVLNFAYTFGAVAYTGYWSINGYEVDYPY